MYREERNEVLSCRRQRRPPARLSYNTLGNPSWDREVEAAPSSMEPSCEGFRRESCLTRSDLMERQAYDYEERYLFSLEKLSRQEREREARLLEMEWDRNDELARERARDTQRLRLRSHPRGPTMVRNYAPSMGFADEHERPTTLERQDFHIPERWDYDSYRPKARLSFKEQADRHLPLKVSMDKPPKLKIVEFDGSPDRYPFFRAQVEEARQYHSDMKILAYLRTSLKGSDFESVRAATSAVIRKFAG